MNQSNGDSGESLDAELLRRMRCGTPPDPPEWLRGGSLVWHREFGRGRVRGLIGRRAYIVFNPERLIGIQDWPKEIAEQNLLPADSVVVEDSPDMPILQHGLETIKEPRFRAFAGHIEDNIHFTNITGRAPAQFVPLPKDLPSPLRAALQGIEVHQFYSHQAEALTYLRQRRDLILQTPTASGKTLAFLPGIFESLLADPQSTALCLYPLKALLYDQAGKILELNEALGEGLSLKIGALSGDTSQADRQALFASSPPRLLALNPDILHHQLSKVRFPQDWQRWREFLSGLKWVVIDEAHSYIGNFGSHMSALIKRLLIAVERLGGDPAQIRFVIATATVGNPHALAESLTGRTGAALVDTSGAAVGERTFLSLLPSSTANPDAARMVLEWLRQDISGIVFCNSRATARSLLNLVRKQLNRRGIGNLAHAVGLFYSSLKGGTRIEITERMRTGRLKVLISTSALEAGVDLPSVDAVLLKGYPGSLMSFRQRAGRCGRSGPGLVIYLPSAGLALDAYYALNPQKLLTSPAEQVAFNTCYPPVLGAHLRCACYESGLEVLDVERWFGSAGASVADTLLRRGEMREIGGIFTTSGRPHREVSIRGTSQDTYRLVDANDGSGAEAVEELSAQFAFREAHPGAIYHCLDSSEEVFYQVEALSLDNKEASVRKLAGDPGYRTRALQATQIELLCHLEPPRVVLTSIAQGRARLALNWGRITDLTLGYEIERPQSEHVCPNERCPTFRQPLSKPVCPTCGTHGKQMQVRVTEKAVHFDAPYCLAFEAPVFTLEINEVLTSAITERAALVWERMLAQGIEEPWKGEHIWVCLHTAEHLLTQAVPLKIIAGAYDIEGITSLAHRQRRGVTNFLFDTCPGGTGAAAALFDRFCEFAEAARELARTCTCSDGCPRCLFRNGCSEWNTGLNKELGLYVLDLLSSSGVP